MSLRQAGMRTLRMKPLEDTVSLTIEIPRGLYELAVRYQEALKDEAAPFRRRPQHHRSLAWTRQRDQDKQIPFR